MRAADVVGKNFQAGHRIGLGLIAEHQVAHFLIGVRLVRAGLDLDQARKDRARGILERIEVKQIAGGMRRGMVLQRALIDLALSRRIGFNESITLRAPSPTRRLSDSPRTNPPPKLMFSAVDEASRPTIVEFRWKASESRAHSWTAI